MSGETQTEVAGARPLLALLLLASVFNFIDRTLIYILFPLIKAEMRLSEVQLSLLGVTSFAIFYAVLGLPVGRLADRVPRTKLLGIGLTVWSAASAATGLMHGFYGLLVCRILVGVGEATFIPCATSLVADTFPPQRRATLSAAFYAGLPIGAGLALFIGGVLGVRYGWRNTFYVCGAPGLLVAALVFLRKEPPRAPGHATQPATGSLLRVAGSLLRIRGFVGTMVGYGLFIIAGQSMHVWLPVYLMAVHGIPLPKAGLYTGLVTATMGLIGAVAGAAIADSWRARRVGGRLRFFALSSLISAPLWIVMLRSPYLSLTLVMYAVLMMISLAFLGTSSADVQDLAGPSRRGIAAATNAFTGNMIGSVLGPLLIGRIADVLHVVEHPEARRIALLVCPAACLLAALILYGTSRTVERTEVA